MISSLLFTGPNCNACGTMKKNVGEAGLTYFEVNISTPEGSKLAQEYHVMTIPTLLLCDLISDSTMGNMKVTPLKSLVGSYPVLSIKQAMNEVGFKEGQA